MSVEYIRGITERYQRLGYAPYRWYVTEDAPAFRPLPKPLAEARVGLLSTAGAYVVGQLAYHYRDDTSIRAIAVTTPDAALRFSHLTENYLPDARDDPQCMLPLAALRTLEREGVIGEIAEQAFSCMGAIYSQRQVREALAPALLAAYRAQGVDAALLVPL